METNTNYTTLYTASLKLTGHNDSIKVCDCYSSYLEDCIIKATSILQEFYNDPKLFIVQETEQKFKLFDGFKNPMGYVTFKEIQSI